MMTRMKHLTPQKMWYNSKIPVILPNRLLTTKSKRSAMSTSRVCWKRQDLSKITKKLNPHRSLPQTNLCLQPKLMINHTKIPLKLKIRKRKNIKINNSLITYKISILKKKPRIMRILKQLSKVNTRPVTNCRTRTRSRNLNQNQPNSIIRQVQTRKMDKIQYPLKKKI